jgi:DNA-binding GntR family transcriptional regulator
MQTVNRRTSPAAKPMSEPVGHRSRADEVYEQLKQDIAEFKLVPGDRFTENSVTERLDVSRTPVRQALVRLQQEGYVEVLFRSGWRVLPLTLPSSNNSTTCAWCWKPRPRIDCVTKGCAARIRSTTHW